MQVNRVAASAGLGWVHEGFRLFWRHPVPMMAITMLYMLTLILGTIVPVLGAFVPLVLTPVLTVGFMQAVRAVDESRQPTPGMLFQGFGGRQRPALRPLLTLGAINAASTVLALGAAALADGGVLFGLATGGLPADDPRLATASLPLAIAAFLLVYTPAQMALWYSPMFIAWHGLPVAKSLFFSLAAVTRNKWAFLQYGLGWVIVALAASLLVTLARIVTNASPMALSLILSPLSLVILTAVYCSFWPSYRDAVAADPRQPPLS